MSTIRWVVCRHIGNEIQEFILRGRLFCIGSAPDNDLVLSAKNIPPLAMKIEPFENGYRCSIVAGGAVRVNGKKIRSQGISHGDEITIGSERLVVRAGVAAEPSECREQMLDNLNRFIDTVGRERELRPLLKNLLGILLELTGGSESFLFTLEPDGSPRLFESSGSGSAAERFSDTIVQTVIDKKEGICIANALTDPVFMNANSIADLRLHSAICVPMLTAGKFVGVVYIGSGSASVSFSPKDLPAVTMYASIAAMLIHHVDFIADQQRTIERLSGGGAMDGIIAGCPVMLAVLRAVRSVAGSDISLLLEGETGTGKNRIAELVHALSRRSAAPFVIVNCSALHGELLESELFGHRKGSFTGATSDHCGLFAAADGGTILLDEIGELESSLQAKLLRTLETGLIRSIGSSNEQRVDVRVVCATNRNLSAMVQEGTFRADLFYRINQFSIIVPPLRQRGGDIELLALLLLDRLKQQYPDRVIRGLTPASLRYLHTHSWPGNIRELSNVLHRALLTASGPLISIAPEQEAPEIVDDFDEATRQFQKRFIERAIEAAGGNKERAAKSVGLSRSTFYRYLSQLL